jgi:hypothetical protein
MSAPKKKINITDEDRERRRENAKKAGLAKLKKLQVEKEAREAKKQQTEPVNDISTNEEPTNNDIDDKPDKTIIQDVPDDIDLPYIDYSQISTKKGKNKEKKPLYSEREIMEMMIDNKLMKMKLKNREKKKQAKYIKKQGKVYQKLNNDLDDTGKEIKQVKRELIARKDKSGNQYYLETFK